MAETNEQNNERLDFIRQMVAEDLETGKWSGRVVNTRFPMGYGISLVQSISRCVRSDILRGGTN